MKYVKTFESWLKNIFKTDNGSIESHNSRIDYRVFLNRWDDLNINESRNPTGHWTKERCQEEALKYNSRSEFKKNSHAYQVSRKNGWLDEMCSHMDELQKPVYWTKERCQEEALKYNSRNEFQRNSVSAYNSSRKNGWLDEICSHMVELYKPSGYWSKEKCQEEALKYNSKSEFKKNSPVGYGTSRKNGWLDEICSHMVGLHKPNNYWTKERCQEEALKYNSKSEFSKNSSGAYDTSRKNGWLDEICSHMVELQKPNGYWTKERCQEEALKYNSKSEFRKNSGSAYTTSLTNGWIDEICSHMLPIGSLKKRYIYSYEFSDKSVYVGLTWNIADRKRRHIEDVRSAVNKYIKNNPNISYEFKEWGYYDMLDAGKMEEEKEKEYINSGWVILNVAKTGSLGGMTIKWTKEKCQEEALKYNSRNEFRKNSSGAYDTSRKNGWLDEICSHMVELQKPDNYWTKERCQEEALKYNSRSEFKKNSGSAYSKSHIEGWFDEICSHMDELKKPDGYWTKERCQEEALKYNSRTEFSKNSKTAYNSSRKNGWIDEICSHMVELKKPDGHWTKERCQEEALKYNSRNEFSKNSVSAYGVSLKNGWIDEICSHMVELQKPVYWTKEKCQEDALKYNSRTEFKKNSMGSYRASLRNGWIDEICSHMVELQKPSGYWTKERCQEEALRYNSRTEFSKNSKTAYGVSLKNGWIDEICSHMVELKTPNGYWTKEKCQEEALKYNSRSDFQKNSGGAYVRSSKEGWLDEICSHMVESRTPNDYWTKEKCQEEALKYNSRNEFQRNSSGAYNVSRKNGWLDEICSHMVELKKPDGHWTKERCQEEALKYNSRSEFEKNSGTAYRASHRNGWIDEICSHMVELQKPDGYWTKEKCQEEALKYNSRTEFKNNSSKAYGASRRKGWLDEICSHMNTKK
jgi:hypothetical protein